MFVKTGCQLFCLDGKAALMTCEPSLKLDVECTKYKSIQCRVWTTIRVIFLPKFEAGLVLGTRVVRALHLTTFAINSFVHFVFFHFLCTTRTWLAQPASVQQKARVASTLAMRNIGFKANCSPNDFPSKRRIMRQKRCGNIVWPKRTCA